MAGKITFTMIKPDAVKAGNTGAILAMINKAGFRIVAMKKTQLTTDAAKAFYAVHKKRPFYGELVEFMTSGPIVAAVLEKANAVEDYRKLIGATNPKSIGENAVHGADSDRNAKKEAAFHFSKIEMF